MRGNKTTRKGKRPNDHTAGSEALRRELNQRSN
ncbi:hypothetical protein PMIN01_03569 [Paraphaeosphaeria minitans]|uniref:Uncharacterized protein n=1 Tax=Paraphaeosphaeria minitans TaxID=565426 RepID=A0A9P6GN36_9PLEO|nr:hypothetical protein PMIN01_03569 [Paraphaeosphaeria minitans]